MEIALAFVGVLSIPAGFAVLDWLVRRRGVLKRSQDERGYWS